MARIHEEGRSMFSATPPPAVLSPRGELWFPPFGNDLHASTPESTPRQAANRSSLAGAGWLARSLLSAYPVTPALSMLLGRLEVQLCLRISDPRALIKCCPCDLGCKVVTGRGAGGFEVEARVRGGYLRSWAGTYSVSRAGVCWTFSSPPSTVQSAHTCGEF